MAGKGTRQCRGQSIAVGSGTVRLEVVGDGKLKQNRSPEPVHQAPVAPVSVASGRPSAPPLWQSGALRRRPAAAVVPRTADERPLASLNGAPGATRRATDLGVEHACAYLAGGRRRGRRASPHSRSSRKPFPSSAWCQDRAEDGRPSAAFHLQLRGRGGRPSWRHRCQQPSTRPTVPRAASSRCCPGAPWCSRDPADQRPFHDEVYVVTRHAAVHLAWPRRPTAASWCRCCAMPRRWTCQWACAAGHRARGRRRAQWQGAARGAVGSTITLTSLGRWAASPARRSSIHPEVAIVGVKPYGQAAHVPQRPGGGAPAQTSRPRSTTVVDGMDMAQRTSRPCARAARNPGPAVRGVRR